MLHAFRRPIEIDDANRASWIALDVYRECVGPPRPENPKRLFPKTGQETLAGLTEKSSTNAQTTEALRTPRRRQSAADPELPSWDPCRNEREDKPWSASREPDLSSRCSEMLENPCRVPLRPEDIRARRRVLLVEGDQ